MRKMRLPISIILIFSTLNLFGQDITKKIGDIEIQLVNHHFKRNSDYKIIKWKSNRKNKPYLKMYFNSSGNLLKTVSFGKQHNSDLRLTNKINIFYYDEGKLDNSIEYESDYQKNIYPYWKTQYIYNSIGQLANESTFYYESDSLLHSTTYEYDFKSNKVKTIFNPNYYYQRKYDSKNRLVSLKQIYDSKLKWEWVYKYENNLRKGAFQTYYENRENHSKLELKTFNKKGQLIEFEEKYTSNLDLGEKIIIHYSSEGLITKVVYYKKYSTDKEYKKVSYTDIKINTKIDIDFKLAQIINNQTDLIK